MKNQMLKIYPLALLSCFAFNTTAHSEEIYEENCWNAAKYDKDGDGYAKAGAKLSKRVKIEMPYSEKKTCPAGWVKARGDCNDRDPDIRPRQREVYGNEIDDNCNDLVDEPVIQNYPTGNDNTFNSFEMFFFVNDPNVLEVRKDSNAKLRVEIEYQKLSDTGHTYRSGLKKMKRFENFEPLVYGEVKLSHLSEATIYRARIQFYAVYTISGRDYNFPIGDHSPWYYTTTEGKGKIGKARTGVLLQGFYEFYDGTRHGMVGYKGFDEADGTRYKAEEGENWCSEFYSWVIKHRFKGIMSRSTVDYVKNFFNNRDAGEEGPSDSTIRNDIRRGDYLAIDSTNDGEVNHSAIFLAYDRHQKEVYTLDGNISGRNMKENRAAGNEVYITSRPLIRVHYWGQLTKDMVRDED